MPKHSGKVTAYTATGTGVTYTVTQEDPPPAVSKDFAVPSPDPRDRALWDAKVNGTDIEVTYDESDPGVAVAVSG